MLQLHALHAHACSNLVKKGTRDEACICNFLNPVCVYCICNTEPRPGIHSVMQVQVTVSQLAHACMCSVPQTFFLLVVHFGLYLVGRSSYEDEITYQEYRA